MRKTLGLLLLFSGLAATSAGTAPGPPSGSVTGTVTLGPQLTARVKFNLYSDPSRPPQPAAPSIVDEFRNVVIYLESAPADSALPPRPREAEPPAVAQERFSFSPHVLPVVKGTTVEFPNRDTVFHNVFSLSKVASFDLGRYPHNASKSVRFDRPGIVKIFCHIHSDMSAIVVVLDNPFFVSPDGQGRFAIDRIPPGDYTIVAWHERARLLSRRIRVEAGGVATVDFDIPLSDDQDSG